MQLHELLTQMFSFRDPCAYHRLQVTFDVFRGPNDCGKLFGLIAEDHLTSTSNGALEPNLPSLKTNRLSFE